MATSTSRGLSTISLALYLFLAIPPLLHLREYYEFGTGSEVMGQVTPGKDRRHRRVAPRCSL
jgi:hypothetical protein